MEVMSDAGYTEAISGHRLEQAQFMAAALEAAPHLGWHIAGRDEQTIIYQTPASLHSQGELVTVTWTPGEVQFRSIPINEYFWNDAQHRHNAMQFKQAMALMATAQHKADRSRNPVFREKFGAFVPSKTYLFTPLILYSIALVYIAMVLAGLSPLHPNAESLFRWGGNFRNAVMDGEWWRLITYMFLHGGIMHLLMNAYALVYIGMFLEPLLGKARFITAYLLTGICAGLASIMMHPFSVGVGASGAIFGMYGAFFALLTTNHLQKAAKKTMLRSILFFIVFNLIMGTQGNTDNAAHIGGLVSGLLIGYAFYPGIRKQAAIGE